MALTCCNFALRRCGLSTNLLKCKNMRNNELISRLIYNLSSNIKYRYTEAKCLEPTLYRSLYGNLHKNKLTIFPCSRHISCSSAHFAKEQSNKEQGGVEAGNVTNELEIGDGTWEEVYKGVLTTQLKLLKMFSISTSLIGLSVQPILFEKIGSSNVAILVALGSIVGTFTLITPLLIHWVSKKYVTKLEYDPKADVYAATTLSFFLKEKKIEFKINDVIRPQIPGMFTSFLVKDRPLFVDPSMFENVDHYSRIMGFDKPIDFSFDREKIKR